jgi:uncharacterized protein YndB with AHSA1/START domain
MKPKGFIYLAHLKFRYMAPLVIERVFDAPVSVLWTALTDKDEMKQWYFDLKEFKTEPGFTFSFTGGTEEKQYLHLCEVIDVIPNKKLSYTWKYDGYTGESKVTFELFPEGNKTRLRLTHDGLETFPALADFARQNFEQGWASIVGTSLKEYIAKKGAETTL